MRAVFFLLAPFLPLLGVDLRPTPLQLRTSIIIPCHSKHFSLLPDLLGSLEAQTVIPGEVVICLTRHQAGRLAQSEYERIERRFCLFPLKIVFVEQSFVGAPRNEACSASSGDLLICQDADDREAYIHHGNASFMRGVSDRIKWPQTPIGEDHRFIRGAFRSFPGKIFLLDERLIIYRPELSSYKNRFSP